MYEILPDIVIDTMIKGGKPVFKGIRVPVDIILGKLAGGISYEELMSEYELKKEEILAALRYDRIL
ncbi:MAG: DUF433 domain-containing protein [Firmicutes bacterium]|nr:DUF433 domain-containing protein [Bacillota bacterium]